MTQLIENVRDVKIKSAAGLSARPTLQKSIESVARLINTQPVFYGTPTYIRCGRRGRVSPSQSPCCNRRSVIYELRDLLHAAIGFDENRSINVAQLHSPDSGTWFSCECREVRWPKGLRRDLGLRKNLRLVWGGVGQVCVRLEGCLGGLGKRSGDGES